MILLRQADKKHACLSEASLRVSRLSYQYHGNPKGSVCGRLFLLTFFGEAKKVSGSRAAPGAEAVRSNSHVICGRTRRAVVCGRLFLGYCFLAKQKEVTGCRTAPGAEPPRRKNRITQREVTTNSTHQVSTSLTKQLPPNQHPPNLTSPSPNLIQLRIAP